MGWSGCEEVVGGVVMEEVGVEEAVVSGRDVS
jgi:hypothetical protein